MNAQLAHEAALRVARIAAENAHAVDRDARFPAEAIDALRKERLLSALVPASSGGAGLTLTEVASVCEIIAQGCASTAMIYAMHLTQAACVISHCRDRPWQLAFVERLAREQLLLGSATSEATTGGGLRASTCAVQYDGQRFRIEKDAPTISYGAYADAILITARRADDSPPSDQVLIVASRAQLALEPQGIWDALGMRGTCSSGFRLVANGDEEQILLPPFRDIANRTMQPVSHTLWAAVWTGIATDALRRANEYCRAQSRTLPDGMSLARGRLVRATEQLQMMKARVSTALAAAQTVHAAKYDTSATELPLTVQLGFMADMNSLKTGISSAALGIAHEAMMICGIFGYRNGGRYSIGRHLRDLYSAPLMINNDRIDQNTASLLLAQRPSQLIEA
ncbi:acyl-CoA dehydrogenase family protein [Paraburkholderia sp. EG287A]|uniref:acyl-CoA dehydrogenase family protein n=1 Tax=unclassified Paraburkholderia TaxID=2615204 RepID=UPI0034D29594